MQETILIQTKDVDLGINYVYSLTIDQAEKVINSKDDDVFDLGGEGNWIQIKEKTIAIRKSSGGGRADLNKRIVFKQISQQLEQINRR